MVEPQEVFFGTSVDVVVLFSQSFRILCNGIASFAAAVEAYPLFVGSVIVGRKPVRTGAGNAAPRFGAVMVSPCEDVVQAEGHHVVHHSLMAVEHHLL